MFSKKRNIMDYNVHIHCWLIHIQPCCISYFSYFHLYFSTCTSITFPLILQQYAINCILIHVYFSNIWMCSKPPVLCLWRSCRRCCDMPAEQFRWRGAMSGRQLLHVSQCQPVWATWHSGDGLQPPCCHSRPEGRGVCA